MPRSKGPENSHWVCAFLASGFVNTLLGLRGFAGHIRAVQDNAVVDGLLSAMALGQVFSIGVRAQHLQAAVHEQVVARGRAAQGAHIAWRTMARRIHCASLGSQNFVPMVDPMPRRGTHESPLARTGNPRCRSD